jgi:PAS domain S-box-containing protein
MAECFQCKQVASKRYTLTLESTVYDNKALCDACVDDFRDTKWIDVRFEDMEDELTESVTTHEARQRLYEIIREDTPFEQKASDALDLGQQYLNVQNGHLTRIDRETDHWEAQISTDPPDGQFPLGLELDLRITYCRRTIEANSPIALHDAPTQGWADDPAFETHGLNCYHGTVLLVNEEPYGTICFVSEDPRRDPFSEEETMFAELLTRLLERELECDQYEAELTRQTNLATVLNRVLRHNLRNDLSVIRGYTQIMAEKLDNVDESETILTNIDELIELSQKARELDQIIATDSERESTDIVALIERVVEPLLQEYSSASVTIESEGEITAPVLPSFDRAFEELIENGFKHGGEDPTVTVTIELVPNAIEIRIADDGPGIPDQEQEVLEKGTETPLIHGSGLGLWLVHWIVARHEASVEATTTEGGTTMTVTLPRTAATNTEEQLAILTQALDRYEAAFEEAADPMIVVNDERQIIDANDETSRVYGLDSEDLLGRPITEFLPEEFDVDAAWQEFKEAGQQHDTMTLISADGEKRRVEYSAQAGFIPGEHLVIMRPVGS